MEKTAGMRKIPKPLCVPDKEQQLCYLLGLWIVKSPEKLLVKQGKQRDKNKQV